MKDSFFGQSDVTQAVENNAKLEAIAASGFVEPLIQAIKWHLNRFGKITSSNFSKVKFLEVKSKKQTKQSILKWIQAKDEERGTNHYLELQNLAESIAQYKAENDHKKAMDAWQIKTNKALAKFEEKKEKYADDIEDRRIKANDSISKNKKSYAIKINKAVEKGETEKEDNLRIELESKCKAIEKKLTLFAEKNKPVYVEIPKPEFKKIEGDVYKLTKAQIEDTYRKIEGDYILTGTALSYLSKLLWECDLDKKKFINDCLELGYIRDDVSIKSSSLTYGLKYEPLALEAYNEQLKVKATPCKTVLFDGYFGDTADFSYHEDGKLIVGEIKNPKNGANHYKGLVTAVADGRYDDQNLGHLLGNKDAVRCDFFTYDHRVRKNKTSLFHIFREDVTEELADLEIRLNRFVNIYIQELDRLGLEVPRQSYEEIMAS